MTLTEQEMQMIEDGIARDKARIKELEDAITDTVMRDYANVIDAGISGDCLCRSLDRLKAVLGK